MTYTIQFSLSKKSITYDPNKNSFFSILDLADKAGVDIRRGCRSGHCGTCAVPLLKGKVEHIFGDAIDTDSPLSILTCSFKAKSDLIIEA
jgi:uncharacterized protein